MSIALTGARVVTPDARPRANFCATCNRVRLTVEGRLLLCLGHEHSIDLRALLRRHPTSDQPVIDVSPGNDWTQLRVWYPPARVVGSTVFPAYGFIYRDLPRQASR